MGCRSEDADLAGHWQGELDCTSTWEDEDGSEDSLVYVADVELDLEAGASGQYPGDLAQTARWELETGELGSQWALWDITINQPYPQGSQVLGMIKADCVDASLVSDGDLVAEGCEAVSPGVGNTELAWDGEDTLTETGTCSGTLERVTGSAAAE